MLYGKTVAVGVCGGIAAYKACEVVSSLKKLGCSVHVIMTANATEFVAPLTFETLSGNRVITGMFDRNFKYEVEHVSLAKSADLFLIAPATANIIAKAAQGIADDFLSTALLATKAKVVFAPAMNTGMLTNEAYRANERTLAERGAYFISSESGLLACGDTGDGRLAEPQRIVQEAIRLLRPRADYSGKTVLVTAGATKEDIDGVRFISNYSSGKMGAALAYAARERGAKVILIAGSLCAEVSDRIGKDSAGIEVVRVVSTSDMFDAVMKAYPRSDIIIKAAAPADYKVKTRAASKIKSENLSLDLVKNPDIAKEIGRLKGGRKLIVFAAETDNLLENAARKLESKNADLVIANDVTQSGAGFDADTNIVTIISSKGADSLPKMSKADVADAILDRVLDI